MTTLNLDTMAQTSTAFKTTDEQDRAIAILTIRRVTRPKGSDGQFVTGWGANRDDHPIFTDICYKWLHNQPIDKDVLFQARFRVGKYWRQVKETEYWRENWSKEKLLHFIGDTSPSGEPDLDSQILEVIKEAAGYGGW